MAEVTQFVTKTINAWAFALPAYVRMAILVRIQLLIHASIKSAVGPTGVRETATAVTSLEVVVEEQMLFATITTNA